VGHDASERECGTDCAFCYTFGWRGRVTPARRLTKGLQSARTGIISVLREQ
jgi:hypothetical protein